jgi:predicted enzyme related to lactoylglutathione lyase
VDKLIYTLRRHPHLSREEFQRYWRDVHAPLVHARASVLGIVRYVQSHTRTDAGAVHDHLRARNGGSLAEFDGVAELWVRRPPGEPSDAARQAASELLDDERNFIDLANSPMTLTAEHVVLADERRLLVATHDHDTTLAWHVDLFDWPVVRQWPGGTLLAVDAATRIEILEGNAQFPPGAMEGTAFVVQVGDLDSVHHRAEACGAIVTQPPTIQPWGHRNLMLRDPNGLTVVAFESMTSP